METSLNSYINRSEEILRLSKGNTKKIDKFKNEFEILLSFLESATEKVKANYNAFLSNNDIKRPDSKIINYNEETNQYHCNIDGLILRGAAGNIYDRNFIRNSRIHAHQVIHCKDGNLCKYVLTQTYCKFYHDPEDLLILQKAGIISPEYYKQTIKYTRNFSNSSWVFTSNNNKYMRQFGSLASLELDLKRLELKGEKEDAIKNYKEQVIHDLLILQIIDKII